MPIRILIADDHEVVRHGLALMLGNEPDFEVVGEARDGREAVSRTLDLQPDVVLLDWKMPRMDGLTAAGEIHRHSPAAHCLMLSGAALETAVFDALDQGIDGFVSKDIKPADLAHAIRVVAAGDIFLGPEITKAIIVRGRREPDVTAVRPTLSPREKEVLQLMAEPLTYRQIGERLHISEETVRTYAKRIFSKLEQPNRTQAVIAAIRQRLITID